jgi:hypothetical protein
VSEDVLRADLGRVLLKLEALQDESIQAALKPKTPSVPEMTADEHMAALHLLAEKDLPARILADFEAPGVVGEATNKLVGYLAAVSRKLERPLAVVIQSSSAAGKSSLMDPRCWRSSLLIGFQGKIYSSDDLVWSSVRELLLSIPHAHAGRQCPLQVVRCSLA